MKAKLVLTVAGLLLSGGLPVGAQVLSDAALAKALRHDDGTAEGKRSIAGGGHAVLFKKPEAGDWCVDRVYLFGSRYGTPQPPREDFLIYITDPEMKLQAKITKPYSLFQRGTPRWVAIDIPPVKVPDEFYVCFVFSPTQTKGVYISYDESIEQSHSKLAVPGKYLKDLEKKYDWMIRARLTQTPKGKVLELAEPWPGEEPKSQKGGQKDQ